jgi:CRISPR-associated protein Cas2
MSMTVAVTRNTPGRFHGFLASAMLEIAPSFYVAPDMRKGVRERIWSTLLEWDEFLDQDGGVVLCWKTSEAPSGLALRVLGWPKKEIIDHEGIWLAVRNLTEAHDTEELDELLQVTEPDPHEDDLHDDHLVGVEPNPSISDE